MPEVRLIGDDGKQIGVIKTEEALDYARERDLDLVEVAADARPPVCRVLDYSKYKYEQEQKQKAARKHQQQINVREIKFRPKIAEHDYTTKKGHVERFLRHRDRVKVTIMFRGREVTHPERGEMILTRLAEDLDDLAIIEQRPIQDGRNMTMLLAPGKGIDEEEAAKAAGVGDESFDPDAPMDDGNPLGTPESEITWQVDVSEFLPQRRAALEAHRSQKTDIDGFLGMPEDVFRAFFSTEHYLEPAYADPCPMRPGWPFGG